MANLKFGFFQSRDEPDQADRRMDLVLQDKHGRGLHVVFDTSARGERPGSGGVIISYPRFSAPWVPPHKFITYQCSHGGSVPDAWDVDYQAALDENHREQDRYFDDFRTIGGKLPGIDAMTAYDHAKNGEWEKVPKGILLEVGRPPMPDDYIKGAMAGNKWALGLTDIIPKWALPLVAMEDRYRAERASGLSAADLDKYADDEEAADPNAMGGKIVPVRRGPGRPRKDSSITV